VEEICFKNQYPSLYNIVRKKSATVTTVLRSNPLNVAFRRSLVGNNLKIWHLLVAKIVNVQLTDHLLVAKIVNVQLTDQRDTFMWSLKQMVSLLFDLCITRLLLSCPHRGKIWYVS
jgi:hypothetical protein